MEIPKAAAEHVPEIAILFTDSSLARILHKSLPDLTSSLIPQEIFLQSPVIKDTGFLQEFPCKTNELRDAKANSCNMRVSVIASQRRERNHDLKS